MMTISKAFLGLLLSVLLLSGWLFPSCLGADLDEEIRRLESFSRGFHLIRHQYLEEVEILDLVRSAIEGMTNRLDRYSEILDREAMEALENQTLGTYTGIGVSMQKAQEHFMVFRVIPDSPAAAAGIEVGDVILEIDGRPVAGVDQEAIRRMIEGPAGTAIDVIFHRDRQPQQKLQRTIVRADIRAESSESFEVEPGILVIRIFQFQTQTRREIDRWLSGRNDRAIILDLRNNPGGLFLAAVETCERFLPVGPLVETRDRSGQVIERYVSRRPVDDKTPPLLAVLMNRYSASGAEIMAGAIQDRGIGVIVGEKSFGKGVVQSVYPLGNDLYLKMTTARYYTPSGRSFDAVGVEPDIEVSDRLGVMPYGADDALFKRALALMRTK
jgi:carboxyl-terminal processing protease